MTHTLHLGDCLDVLRTMPDCSVDACVTDPPYGLSFMGKGWDHGVPGVEFWTEALRVAKPGAHLLAFGGTRTFHRLAVAIEDAGWEIRDCVMWVYGSGFPKSLDVSKAIDKAAGAEREKVPATGGLHKNANLNDDGWSKIGDDSAMMDSTVPATDAARQWSGWGTALKPAWEPVIVARKPLVGTVAENVLRHGTGAINVDGCRIGTSDTLGRTNNGREHYTPTSFTVSPVERTTFDRNDTAGGRWPANLIHDGSGEVVGLFPEAQGMARSTFRRGATTGTSIGGQNRYGTAAPQEVEAGYGDSGSAARFFKQCSYREQDFAELDCATVKQWNQQELSPARDTAEPMPEAEEVELGNDSSTTSFGSSPTGQSPTECKSTTSTETSKTTGLKTCSLSPQQSTSGFTPSTSAGFHQENGSAAAQSVGNGSQPRQNISTSVPKDGCSTEDASHAIAARRLPINNGDVRRLYYTAKATTAERQGTTHPTTKPLDLMAYLCRLVTPPGGIVLDPFMGSGTTIKAAIGEGFQAIGIERDPAYFAMAEHRLNGAQLGLSLF